MFEFLLSGILTIGLGHACIYPTGFGTDEGELDPDTLSVPDTGIFGAITLPIVDYIGMYETPIQFRLSQIAISIPYSAMAAFEENALDFFARIKESGDRRRCSDELEFDLHRRVTLAYASYFGWSIALPEAEATMAETMASFGLPTNMCSNCTQDESFCEDTSTPWGLAWTLTKEINGWHMYDGWNADGSLSREYNKIPYQDFMGDDSYIPRNSPWDLRCQRAWQPLLESDEKGFLFYQEHVVPHIGQTYKSIFFTDQEICDMKAPNPKYKLNNEIDLLLSRMAKLNDTSKMEVEFFDSKLTSILPLILQYYLFRTTEPIISDSFEWLTVDIMITNILYESISVVWKEKVRWDKVRPPSIIQQRKSGEYVTTYAGTDEDGATYGTQTFLGDDFEPYIRTMPHAEYPSGSSCVCRAVTNAVAYWEGSDDLTIKMGGPLLAHFPFGWTPGSSSREPGSTPQETVSKVYYSWSEIADRCGLSRLDGGLHFTASVPAGDDLCGPIGYHVAAQFEKMVAGVRPDYIVDINDTAIRNRDC